MTITADDLRALADEVRAPAVAPGDRLRQIAQRLERMADRATRETAKAESASDNALVDAILLGHFYDCEPWMYGSEAEALSKFKAEPTHIDDAERMVARIKAIPGGNPLQGNHPKTPATQGVEGGDQGQRKSPDCDPVDVAKRCRRAASSFRATNFALRQAVLLDEAALCIDRLAAAKDEGRREGLKEAAKVADDYAREREENAADEGDVDYRNRYLVYAKHVRRVAAAIRALAKAEGKDG